MSIRLTARFTSLALAASLALGSAGIAGEAGSDDLAGLAASWDEAFNSGDATQVASMYADDAQVITGDGTVKTGPDEIEALFQSFIDSGFGEHRIEVTQAEVNGDMGYLTGTWSGVGGDGKDYGGHLANVYERQADGDWKAVVHIWN